MSTTKSSPPRGKTKATTTTGARITTGARPTVRPAVRRVPRAGAPSPSASEKRSYRQFCGVARALDMVGERWTLLIARNLLLGPRRYSDLLAELPGITTNLLAKRLTEMTGLGLIERDDPVPPLATSRYRLTETGSALEPVILELGRFGWRWLGVPQRSDTVNIGWGLLSLKRRYTGGLNQIVEFKIGQRSFELELAETHLRVQERVAVRPHVTVSGALEAFQAWLFRGADPLALRARGGLIVAGGETAWRQLVKALPPPATPT